MATERTAITPFGTVIFLDENKDAMSSSSGVISIEDFVIPTAGAVMNQLQGSNVGADLFNGTIQ